MRGPFALAISNGPKYSKSSCESLVTICACNKDCTKFGGITVKVQRRLHLFELD